MTGFHPIPAGPARPLRSDAEGFEFTEIPAGRYRLMGSLGEPIGYLGEEFALVLAADAELVLPVAPRRAE